MNTSNIDTGGGTSTSRASSLAMLMSLDVQIPAWSPADLAAILKHQLAVKLAFDLSRLTMTDGAQIDSQQTFGDLLLSSNPSLESLKRTKDFAKASRADAHSPLPTEVATVLYYAAIVAARLRHQAKITELPEDDLAKGVQWALAQPWLTPELKVLFEQQQ